MSSQEPQSSSASAAPSNDTLINIPLTGVANLNPLATEPIVAAAEEPIANSGSQRSLNSRLFPFRFSRDILINNVSSVRSSTLLDDSLFIALGFSRNTSTRTKYKLSECSVCFVDAKFHPKCAKRRTLDRQCQKPGC